MRVLLDLKNIPRLDSFDLVLVSKGKETLQATAQEVESRYGVKVTSNSPSRSQTPITPSAEPRIPGRSTHGSTL